MLLDFPSRQRFTGDIGGGSWQGVCTQEECLFFGSVRENLLVWLRFRTAVKKRIESKKTYVPDSGTWHPRVRVQHFGTKRGNLSVLRHFSGTSGTREAEKVCAFVKRRQTKPSNVLNQDNSQLLRRSAS